MTTLRIEKREFPTHPEGQSEGIVADVEDLGEVEVTYNGKTEVKHQVRLRIESFDAVQEDGEPFVVLERCNLSGSKKSKLRKRRESILGRRLEGEEPWQFDTSELVGICVGYVVVHNETEAGVFGNLDSIWRLKDQARAEGWKPSDNNAEGDNLAF